MSRDTEGWDGGPPRLCVSDHFSFRVQRGRKQTLFRMKDSSYLAGKGVPVSSSDCREKETY
jgi:hypothetical protein